MLTIGLELISSETVALTELVKNAYDADASYVLVRLTGPVNEDRVIEPGEGAITVLDDGVGMSPETITNVWLEPATPSRRRQRKSGAGRRILGEKGVGRFAAAKLAQRLELISHAAGCPEVKVAVNWRDFENEDAYLEDIRISVVNRRRRVSFKPSGEVAETWREVIQHHFEGPNREQPEHLPNSERGTLLRMAESRTAWDADFVAGLRTTLARLVSPFGANEDVTRDFTIILEAPVEFGVASGPVEPPEELDRPHYVLEASVDALGRATGEMLLKGGEPVEISTQLLNADDETPDADHPLQCGSFTIRLRVWDRDAESLAQLAGSSQVSSVRSTLDAAAGISIYRDKFRVLPYGEPGDDWLRLDLRRVQSPTRRLSNNQIVGYIVIGRDTNPALVDQTNREGIVHGPAFDDLRHAVLQLLLPLENARYKLRPRRERTKRGGLLDRIDLSALRDAIAAELPKGNAITAMVVDLQRELDQRTEDVGQALARYHRLATLGQLVDRVVHELGQPLLIARQAADLGLTRAETAARMVDENCRPVVEDLSGRLTTIRTQARVASDVLRRIAPFGGRKRGRPLQIKLEKSIADAVALLGDDVHKLGVQVTLPTSETTVTIDGTELQEVIVNLLTNSLYWLRRVPKASRRIDIRVERNPDRSLAVIVEDSGPGVPEEDQPNVFDPYFTTREGGVGLGLSIAGEIVEDYYGGKLELLPSGELGGALFRATLRRRVS